MVRAWAQCRSRMLQRGRTMSDPILPMVDFTRIPEEYEGLWVVLRVGREQRILGAGSTIAEAVEASGVEMDDPTAVLTQVPEGKPFVVMTRSEHG